MFTKIIWTLGIVLILLVLIALYRRFFLHKRSIEHLPIRMMGFHELPAIPFILSELPLTLSRISKRQAEAKQAKAGLTTEYTIKDETATAYAFAFGENYLPLEEQISFKNIKAETKDFFAYQKFTETSQLSQKLKNTHESPADMAESLKADGPKPPLTTLSLDEPAQFSMAWSTFNNLHQKASAQWLEHWSKSLTDAEEATKQFWKIISQYSAAYNLLIVEKITKANKDKFTQIWTPEAEEAYETQQLFGIDLGIFECLELNEAKGSVRFTPAVCMLLRQDAGTKQLLPFSISVAGKNGNNKQIYDRKTAQPAAWLYAMQASKTAATVYGIWIGHVYHWHIVNATMIMNLLNHVPDTHALSKLIAPQARYTIGFNESLLFLWKIIAPPTSLTTSHQLLELLDKFAKKRLFFDDDPKATLEKMNIRKEDFSVEKDWDTYPVVAYYLKIWDLVAEYVEVFVEVTYPSDEAVREDKALASWLRNAADPHKGNIKGLPELLNRHNLKMVLCSLLYRMTVHGIPNLENTLSPAMTFVANYPPCLQNSHIPSPSSSFDTKELLTYLPTTGTIGEMINFYYTFIHTAPYETFVPLLGVDDKLFFSGGAEDRRNQALMTFREGLSAFVEEYSKDNQLIEPLGSPQIHQWSLSVEV